MDKIGDCLNMVNTFVALQQFSRTTLVASYILGLLLQQCRNYLVVEYPL